MVTYPQISMENEPKHIIVIGTSAGGLNALNELVNQFKEDWNAAFFIVLHLSRKGISDFLVHRLQQYTTLKCVMATENGLIKKGHIYIAMPNLHLVLKKGVTKLGHGPEENRWRPSVDVLFRSAAAAYDGCVTGIILTGLLDDGTSGMWAIKRSGGTCIVQDPNEAEYPDMPISVLNKMEVDYCVALSEMGAVLDDIITKKEIVNSPIPQDVQTEAEIAEKMATGIDIVNPMGENTVYSCPDCGGNLWLIENGKINKYRCHIGHSYSELDLQTKQAKNVEATLWVALRMMEERKNLLKRMEAQSMERGYHRFAKEHYEKANELQEHINKLKEILFMFQRDETI